MVFHQAPAGSLVAVMLRLQGWVVTQADGDEDARRLLASPGSRSDFHLLVTDSVVQGCDGGSLARHFQSICPEAGVVVAGTQHANGVPSADDGEDWIHITKPFGMNGLCDAVDRALRDTGLHRL